jgi:hypothetical protein
MLDASVKKSSSVSLKTEGSIKCQKSNCNK